MDGIRIIVDELPDECWDCMLYVGIDFSSHCAVTKRRVDLFDHNRLPNCPLVEEEENNES